MKIGKRYIYLLKVCRAIDEAHLEGLCADKAHVHFNPGHGQEEAPTSKKGQKEPPTLPLPFTEGLQLSCEPSGDTEKSQNTHNKGE
jgi:hypothetical protein